MEVEKISADQIISIRSDIAVCPYCKAPVYVTAIESLVEDEHGWKAEGIELQCGSEPEIDNPEWDDWLEQHSYMPYVYQLPVELKVIGWLNRHYRYAI